MADITTNQNLRFKGEIFTQKWKMDSSAAQHAYRGGPMILDLSEDTLNVRAYLDATVVAATDVFVGIALEEKAVLINAVEADHVIDIAVGPTIVGFVSAVFDDADVGKTVYMSDSGTLSETAADNPQIGKLIRVEGGYAYVELSGPQICTGA